MKGKGARGKRRVCKIVCWFLLKVRKVIRALYRYFDVHRVSALLQNNRANNAYWQKQVYVTPPHCITLLK
jgi:hypothetical protein